MELTTHLHLVLHLQMSDATPLLTLHIFICADQLYFFMFQCVINTHYALCPITTFCTESHADSKDKSTNHNVTISPEVQVILRNCRWQYHLQQDGAVTPSAEWAKYQCQVSSCRHWLYCLHNNSLFWSMFSCNMFWLLSTVIFSHFVYNYKDNTPAYNH